MSRAVVFDEYGGPDVLHLAEVDLGEPGPGEVLVRVRAAGVQPADCMLRSGRMAQWVPASFPQGLGNEFAGTVEAVGAGAGIGVGDEVIGWTSAAAYADHVLAPASQMALKPADMPWAEAGALSASGQTAATALKLLRVEPGETLLLHAAAGGVGHLATQLARARGAAVIGTASPENHEFLVALGATPVVYGPGLDDRLQAAAPDGADAALIAVDSREAAEASLRFVGDADRVAIIAYSPSATELGIRRISTERSVERLTELTEQWEAGQLRVHVARTFALEDAAPAHEAVETGHGRGKVVITP